MSVTQLASRSVPALGPSGSQQAMIEAMQSVGQFGQGFDWENPSPYVIGQQQQLQSVQHQKTTAVQQHLQDAIMTQTIRAMFNQNPATARS